MELEYRKARQLALQRVYPELFEDPEVEWVEEIGEPPAEKIPRPPSVPLSLLSLQGKQNEGISPSEIPIVDIEAFRNMKLDSITQHLVDAALG